MVFRLRDYLCYPKKIIQFHHFLQDAQYWTTDKRRGWIQEQLERLLFHSVNNVPYYQRTLSPFKSHFKKYIDCLDLSELPSINKEIIRNHFEELMASNTGRIKTGIIRTSGTTGTPTQFILDHYAYISHFASIWRVLNWIGYRFGNRFAEMAGQMLHPNRLSEYDIRLNCLRLNSRMKKEDVPFYFKKLKSFNPVFIKAGPTTMNLFSRWIKELGMNGYHPPAILTCAETLFKYQKENIEQTLACKVYDFYNQNEMVALISTCEKQKYHIHEEYSFVEIDEKPSLHSVSSDMGEIVATTLHNFAMPLIRYQTRDLVTLDRDNLCSCGRTYRQVKKIIGRLDDLVVTPEDRYVADLNEALLDSPGIQLSQIIQESIDKIHVKIVKSPFFTKKDYDNLEHGLRIRLGERMNIEYQYADSIPLGRNGKHQFIISKPYRELILSHKRIN